jgi:large subunit ribosomal protein L23
MSEKIAKFQGEGRDVLVSGKHEWYAFEVEPSADKTSIKRAVEELYVSNKIKVVGVRIQNCRGRGARTAKGMTAPRHWKKALVKLAEGQTLTQT